VPGLIRKSVKPSESILAFAAVLAAGFTFVFLQRVWLENSLNWRHIEFATLPFYWLMWNLLPLTLFAIGKLLQRQGK
jgi:hypothetical protein